MTNKNKKRLKELEELTKQQGIYIDNLNSYMNDFDKRLKAVSNYHFEILKQTPFYKDW